MAPTQTTVAGGVAAGFLCQLTITSRLADSWCGSLQRLYARRTSFQANLELPTETARSIRAIAIPVATLWPGPKQTIRSTPEAGESISAVLPSQATYAEWIARLDTLPRLTQPPNDAGSRG